VSGEIGDEYKFYFKQAHPNASWLSLRFNIDSAFRYTPPVNIISPYVMDFVFMELYSGASAAANYNFDSLFVPFRCMASDVVEKKAIALSRGNLGNAIRASMTYPFYFRPIRIDGSLLFDGGLYNNFPADVMCDEFFPEIIVGSRVASDFSILHEDDLASQLQAMLTTVTDYEIPCKNGVLIQPQLRGVNVIDFRHTKAFIDSGYVAAKRMIPEIRKFVYDTVSLKEVNQRRQEFIDRKPPLIVNHIHISGLAENQIQYVSRLLRLGEEQVPLVKMKKEYFKLIADDKINHIFPQLKFNEQTGFFDLYLDAKMDNELRFEVGGNLSSSSLNSAFVGARYNLLGLNALALSANSYFGRFYSSVHGSARFDLSTKLPVYIEPMITYNQWDFFTASTHFFEDKTPSFLLQRELTWTLSAGIPTRNTSRLVAGISSFRLKDEYYQTNYFRRADTADYTTFIGKSPFLMYEVNTLNNKQYANRGNYFHSSLRLVSGEEIHQPGSTAFRRGKIDRTHTWWQFRMRYESYLNIASAYRFGICGELVLSNMKAFTNYTSTALRAPAFNPVPISKTWFAPAYRAHNYAAIGFKNIFIIRRNLCLRLEGFAFMPYKEILRDDNFLAYYGSRFRTVNMAAAATLVFHSPIGPVSMGINYFEKNEVPLSFSLNLGYILFNPRVFE